MAASLVSSIASVSAHATRERARVQAHLRRAERHAGRAPGPADAARRLVRALLLDELQRYRRRGRFPLNLDFADPTPYFVDAQGTRCAVAHLLDVSGETELVRRIARERNHARVAELADEPRLVAWLAAVGITLEEAALIQPEYCVGGAPIACVCDPHIAGRLQAVIDGTILDGAFETPGDDTTWVRVEAIYGESARFEVGDKVLVSPYTTAPAGDPIAVLVTSEDGVFVDGGTFLRAKTLSSDGHVVCQNDEGTTFPQLTVEEYSEALFAKSCKAYLKEMSSAWELRCRKTGGPLGCALSAGTEDAPPTTHGILLVLLSALAWRRRRAVAQGHR